MKFLFCVFIYMHVRVHIVHIYAGISVSMYNCNNFEASNYLKSILNYLISLNLFLFLIIYLFTKIVIPLFFSMYHWLKSVLVAPEYFSESEIDRLHNTLFLNRKPFVKKHFQCFGAFLRSIHSIFAFENRPEDQTLHCYLCYKYPRSASFCIPTH